MTTSPEQFLNEIIDLDHSEISPEKIGYFRQRFRNRLFQLVLQKFLSLEDSCGFTKADLARRIGREPAQVTRWLGTPGNWTLDTVSDLLIAMAAEPAISANDVEDLMRPRKAVATANVTPQKPETLKEMASARLPQKTADRSAREAASKVVPASPAKTFPHLRSK